MLGKNRDLDVKKRAYQPKKIRLTGSPKVKI
jgi:hypothetical protein